ncbi:MAG: ribonuclease HI [Gammaproteobacteria bacterium]|nr:ribonuclease HI [Gammaproteobacteria bacterium]
MKKVAIFTDGACRGNPGPGGWGALLRYDSHEKTLHGGESYTTNNRMELTAAIKALQSLRESCQIDLTTDSEYVRKGVTEWMQKWKRNDWRGSNKKPVKNKELWQVLDVEVAKHVMTWHWVKGHSGHRENEMADQLANKGIDELER